MDNVKIQTNEFKIMTESRKKKKKRIFLDLDGVVVDWIGGCCKSVGLNDIQKEENKERLKNGDRVYDILGITEKEMWDRINDDGEKWWINLEILPWGKKLYKELNKVGDVCFLSSPSENSNSFSGKAEWIKKHFGKCPFLLGEPKQFCAMKESVLIDDSKWKVDLFREWGGNAYIWPNQYRLLENNNVDNVIEKLVKIIKGLQ